MPPQPPEKSTGTRNRAPVAAGVAIAAAAVAIALAFVFARPSDGQDSAPEPAKSLAQAPAAPGGPGAAAPGEPSAPDGTAPGTPAAPAPGQDAAPGAAAPAAQPRAQAPIVEGRDYNAVGTPLKLTPDEEGKPLELVYIFWFGCGTCRRIDPAVTQFFSTLPEDVRAFRIPAMYEPNATWMIHARLFYTLDQLEREQGLHGALFAEVQDNGGTDPGTGHPLAGLTDLESMIRFAESRGIAREEFEAAWNSPETMERYRKALAYIDNLNLDSVPAMGVNGRYGFPIGRGGPGRFFATAQKLLDDERARLAAAE
jgi:thiol:disulfide interchange protein DsbA